MNKTTIHSQRAISGAGSRAFIPMMLVMLAALCSISCSVTRAPQTDPAAPSEARAAESGEAPIGPFAPFEISDPGEMRIAVTGSRIKRRPVLVGKSTWVYGSSQLRIVGPSEVDQTGAATVIDVLAKRGLLW